MCLPSYSVHTTIKHKSAHKPHYLPPFIFSCWFVYIHPVLFILNYLNFILCYTADRIC